MKKVIIFNNDAWTTQKHRIGIIRNLERMGYHVVVLAGHHKKYSPLLAQSFDHIPLRKMQTTGMNPLAEWRLFNEIEQIYKKVQPDICLHYTMKPNIYGGIICQRLNIPYISTVNGLGRTFSKKGLLYRLMTNLLKKGLKEARKIFFQNQDDFQLFNNLNIVNTNNCSVIPGSGINTQIFVPDKHFSPSGKRKFLLAARLLKEKGIPEYISAARSLKSRYPDAIFRLLGPISDPDITEYYLQQCNDEGFISYGGETNDMIGELENADIVVLPTYYREGIPKILIEALSCGKPIITTNFIGSRETVVPHKNGLLIPVKDPDALTKAMIQLNESANEKLLEMGSRSRQMALEKFDEKIIIRYYLDVIEDLENT